MTTKHDGMCGGKAPHPDRRSARRAARDAKQAALRTGRKISPGYYKCPTCPDWHITLGRPRTMRSR